MKNMLSLSGHSELLFRLPIAEDLLDELAEEQDILETILEEGKISEKSLNQMAAFIKDELD